MNCDFYHAYQVFDSYSRVMLTREDKYFEYVSAVVLQAVIIRELAWGCVV